MKLIIAGNRDRFPSVDAIGRAVHSMGIEVTEVVNGGASGVDAQAWSWATLAGLPVKPFPADWGKHGKAAGPIRNRQMAEYADALLAIWDGQSPGTRNMVQEMGKLGKPTTIFHPDAL